MTHAIRQARATACAWHRGRRSGSAVQGFTLIELLVVVSVVALLAAVLMPALSRVRLQSRITKVRAELYQIGVALETYEQTYKQYPHANACCWGGGQDALYDYSHLPTNLGSAYKITRAEDPFNPQAGATYKYLRPGLGYQNGAAGGMIQLWVPKKFPYDQRNEPLDAGWQNDKLYFTVAESPVSFVLWSVGPGKPMPDAVEADMNHYPVPKRTWYQPSRGMWSRGVIPFIKSRKHGFQQWTPNG